MSLLKLTGGPRDGTEVQIDDMNHMTILYPGYTAVSQAIDPEAGEVIEAEWTGSDFDEAAYQGILNPKTAESAHDHSEDDADQEHLEGAQTASEASVKVPSPPPLPQPIQASSASVQAPPPPPVPEVPAAP